MPFNNNVVFIVLVTPLDIEKFVEVAISKVLETVRADVWSVTSYKQLRTDALAARRWNMLHPGSEPKKSYLETILEKTCREPRAPYFGVHSDETQ